MSKKPERSRLRTVLRRTLIVLGVLVVLFGAFVAWALLTCFAEPPELAARPEILDVEVTARDGRRYLGKSWFERRPGRSRLYLEGDAFTLGYANATLTRELLVEQERSLFTKVRQHFTSDLSLYAIGLVVLVNNRSLPSYVRLEHQLEILGLSRGDVDDPFPEFGPRYHRLLNYHAAHDISHWVWDQPVLGCTAFAARGERTADGHLLVGRNFDWESGEHFDRNKVIACYRPSDGHAFLSVIWPGMAGAVTGLNEKRLFCSINGAHSEHKGRIGRPVSLVVREVLQHAATVDEAIEIIDRAEVFVADSYMIASGASGSAAVVEKAPGHCSVRPMSEDLTLQANHFETAAFAEDAGNLEYMSVGTSVARRARLAELLDRSEPLTPTDAVRVLRDRFGPGDTERALGHRGTINAMIATHSVVCDVTDGVLWVSRGPHQLGEFDAYTIERFGQEIGRSIAADPALNGGDYDRLVRHRAHYDAGKLALAEGDVDTACRELEAATTLLPTAPLAQFELGRALRAAGESERARAAFEAARRAIPPFQPVLERIEQSLAELTST